jgi:hypothetical protein
VSTVWLGSNHDFYGEGNPIIFETMIFECKNGEVNYSDLYMDRYCTEDEAIAGHLKAVELAKTGKFKDD